MKTAEDLVAVLKREGIQLGLEGEDLRVNSFIPIPEAIRETLRASKLELIQFLRAKLRPHMSGNGDLVIPFDCLSHYRWWDETLPHRVKLQNIWEEVQKHLKG